MLEYRENGFQHYQPYSAGRDDKKIELQFIQFQHMSSNKKKYMKREI